MIKPPTFTIERALELAQDYVKTQKIDVSRHFLSIAECLYLRDEMKEPCGVWSGGFWIRRTLNG